MVRDHQRPLAVPAKSSRLDRTVASDLTGHARFIDWFQRWWRPVRSWIAANSCVPRAEVDDLTQEVFLRLLRYSDDVLVKNPRGYLCCIATNVVLEWKQRCRVRMPHDDRWLEELQIEAANEPESAIARVWATRCLQAAVSQLPARQREVLLLHVDEGLTYQQIAERRHLTYRMVLRDLTRAYGKLRRQVVAEDL